MTAVADTPPPIRARSVGGPDRRLAAPRVDTSRLRPRKVQIGGPDPHLSRAEEVLSQIDDRAVPDTAPPLPDPTALACRVARAALEVLHGQRPAHQLARWTSAQVYDQLLTRAHLLNVSGAGRRRPLRVGIRRVRLLRLGTTSAEATVILHDGSRVRAAAVRLEGRRGTWRVTCLELG